MLNSEPVLTLAAVATLAVALLQGVASGDVDSVGEWVAVALPIVFGFIQRTFVTPVAPEQRGS